VERFAPVPPPRAILDETEVPFHVNAAPRLLRQNSSQMTQRLTV
jgi:hypothetical protein